MASGRRLRTRSSGMPAQLSECGHDRSQLDFSSNRDIQCKICWENREILIQRLIEPFEHALETLKDNTDSGSVNSTPERVPPAVVGNSASIGRTRSLRRRAGKKRTRSISPLVIAATTPMKIDGGDLLSTGGPSTSKPEEEDCIHVQDISVVAIQRPKKRSKSPPEQSKIVKKIAALELQKSSANIIPPAAVAGKARGTSGATTERLQENSSLVDAAAATAATPTAKSPKLQEKSTPTSPTLTSKIPKQKPRTSQLSPKRSQQTLFSFFTKSADGAAVKTENAAVTSNIPRPAPIFIAGGGGGGVKRKEIASSKVNEDIVVRKSTPSPPARAGIRKSARDVTVKSRETVNYREDSDSDIDLE